VLESTVIAVVPTGNTKVTDISLLAIDLEFAIGEVVALLNSQVARTYVNPLVAKKFGRSFTG